MLNLAQLGHGHLLLAPGYAQPLRHHRGAQDVEHVALSHKGGVHFSALPSVHHGKLGARCGVADVCRPVIHFRGFDSVAYYGAVGWDVLIGGNSLGISVYHAQTVGRKASDEFELGLLDVLLCLEGFKVHLAHGGNNSDGGMHKVAYLLDVSGLLCSHLNYEHLVHWLKLFADGADHA